ncbi:MAG: 1-acyl-sn-glycerol-3-phosphate acyltransferase [Pseudomonadales bacterium]|nr:1-acyl-sn-glycerol-3-phosphate acyltransferase [Pseudomonadales bacterium]
MSMKSDSVLYSFVQRNITPVVKMYSRLEVVGLENIPTEGKGALLACNHSGSVWWDALCLIAGLGDRPVNFVAHHWDAKLRFMRLFLENFGCGFLDEHVCDICESGSVVKGVQSGKLMCIYPEESYHSFRHRYTLFKFSAHVVKYADLAKVPIIPITIIGAEEAAATFFGPKLKKVPLHIPLHPPIILPFKVTIDIGKPCFYEELLPSDTETLMGKDECYTQAAEQLRKHMFSTMSQYRTCRLSDEKYIDRHAWY